MARLPTVAIIGRPNTGKSTLFNSLLWERLSIVSDIPGTTRDHIASVVDTDDLSYVLLDTGGMGGGTDDADFEDDVHAQSLLAIEAADLILFTINAREELTKSDDEVVSLLRRKRKRHVPVILVLTKCDNDELQESALATAHGLGISDRIIPVSAISNVGTKELRETVADELRKLHFGKRETPAADGAQPRVAVVGKPNVGKSSLVNALMNDVQRKESPRLVSDIPGTTRDSTDVLVRSEGRTFVFVDTAGLRKQARIEEELESYSILRTIHSIDSADVAVLVLDGTQPISKQDKHIAGLIVEAGKGLILLLNKSDLMTSEQKEAQLLDIRRQFAFCKYAPVLTSSAVTRENLPKLFNLIEMAHRNRLRRFPIKELNEWLPDVLHGQPMGGLSSAKHITQAEDPPPTFILFVKNPKFIRISQLRFLENRLREHFGLEGTPVRWITKGPHDR